MGEMDFVAEIKLLKRMLEVQYQRLRRLLTAEDEMIDLIPAPERIGTQTVFSACELTDAERGSLMIVDASTGSLVMKGARGINPLLQVQLSARLGEGIAGWVAQSGRALLVADIDAEPRIQALKQRHSGSYRGKSFISVPLKSHDMIVGVLSVSEKKQSTDSQSRIFDEIDLSFMTLLGHFVAQAMTNATLNEQVKTFSPRDPLTGAFNRGYMERQLQEEIKRGLRYGRLTSAILIDVDHFKECNDSFGHLAGDEVLKSIASTIQGLIRESDCLCRFGGDEFVVILPETDELAASGVAEKLRRAVEQLQVGALHVVTGFSITVSCGIATAVGAVQPMSLLQHADEALYVAKRAGRNRIHVWHIGVPE